MISYSPMILPIYPPCNIITIRGKCRAKRKMLKRNVGIMMEFVQYAWMRLCFKTPLCATCILRWVTYSQKPTCPQCKHPFEFLNVHRSLDGSIQDYMFEESVCLLLRAKWFEPLVVEEREDVYEGHEDYYCYPYEDEEDDDLDDAYFSSSSVIRIGNRRWGDNGYVRGGRQEARPVRRSNIQDPGASSSGEPRKKEAAVDKTGRRAKRALKREAADKAAAEKHQQHLARLGRK
ncbi:uncharacterized protein [Malus domestica]|uniref:uncharacterized protein isoform X2 n=1 Tax=Malus domestica TaxID=3750 RepID=UPI0007ED8082